MQGLQSVETNPKSSYALFSKSGLESDFPRNVIVGISRNKVKIIEKMFIVVSYKCFHINDLIT